MCDMDLAKIKVGCSTMTCVQVVGTPCYAAPENFEGTAGKPSYVWGLWNGVPGTVWWTKGMGQCLPLQ